MHLTAIIPWLVGSAPRCVPPSAGQDGDRQGRWNLAKAQASVAVGNAAAALTVQQDAVNKTHADQEAAAIPDANVDAQLQRLGALRKD